MLKIGITGQSGFIGTHLYNTLCLAPDKFLCVQFKDEYFSENQTLDSFVKECDVIIHLAAINRHPDPVILHDTNIRLVKDLISACKRTGSHPHIVFSSSSQENKDNLYGNSKHLGRQMFEKWAADQGGSFTGLIIPNVFGPFCKPFYNSVVATFCYQLTHGQESKIEIDSQLELIYIGELVELIINEIERVSQLGSGVHIVETKLLPYTASITVSQLLLTLVQFKENYFSQGAIPDVSDRFTKNLFNTFITYLDYPAFFPFKLKTNIDHRGLFSEVVKLSCGGQVSFSTTKSGITRGQHFHTRKAERFVVIKGKAIIQFRKVGTEKIFSFELNGEEPAFVDMPVWFTHSITNIGDSDLYTLFWINEEFNPINPDTFFEQV